MSHRWIFLPLALAVACDGAPEPDPVADPVAEPAEAPQLSLSAAELQQQAEEITLVPSPAEMQAALEKAGLTSRLASMVGERSIGVKSENLDQVAVRTGVILAEVVLTVKETPKERFVERMNTLKEGFNLLGAGSDIPNTIDDINERVMNDAVSRDDLLKEVDELSGVMVPELETEAGDWVVPLIQAGSWLEGSHLVAGAIQNEEKFGAAAALLKQPSVVDYFLSYVQREGRDKAPDEVVKQLEQTLLKLKEIAAKETLTADDVKTIHDATGAVLELL
ncbi:MAG: hypothetical protein ACI8S6_001902 [Myxococcota bacterium]|jgi:hypothetical protein